MKTAVQLGAGLTKARFRTSKGMLWLEVLAVACWSVSTWMFFTVASGTWALWMRRDDIPQGFLDALEAQGVIHNQTQYADLYVVAAFFACALLIVPILGLGGAAARLGAQSKAESLAAMRLVGLSSGQATTIRVIESLATTVAGIVVGIIVWIAMLPLWSNFTFQTKEIVPNETLLPWWLILGGIAVLLLLSVASTVLGLRQVWISPLGVAKRGTQPGVKLVRLMVFAFALAAFFYYITHTEAADRSVIAGVSIAGVIMLALIAAVQVVSPWILQHLVRPGTASGTPSTLLAARRIQADPKRAWRAVGTLSLMLIVGTFGSVMVEKVFLGNDPLARQLNPGTGIFLDDLRTGMFITLIFAAIIGGMVGLTQQASGVIERADVTKAMDWAGAPVRLHLVARLKQALFPLATGLTIGVGVGLLLTIILTRGLVTEKSAKYAVLDAGSWQLIGTVSAVAILLTVIGVVACIPLERGLLGRHTRRND